MKKPTQKRVKECLKDIENNFSELIDYIIFYEKNNMDDWSYDIIGYLEKQSNATLIKQLFDDLSKRSELDKSNCLYKSLWYAILNNKQNEENTYSLFIEKINNDNKNLTLNFFKSLDEGENSDTEKNLRNFLKTFNQKIKFDF
jgi:uncharacterized membrane protein